VRIVKRPERPQSVPNVVLDSIALDEILTDADRQRELNFWEVKLIRDIASESVPFDEIHLLRLRVDDPSRAAADPKADPALEFTFGFALTNDKEFVYFRVQDHVRRMGLARDALLELCKEGYSKVATRCARKKEEQQGWHRFQVLLDSARRTPARGSRPPLRP